MTDARNSTNLPMVYQGIEIHRRHEMLSLTDMWRAAGKPDGRAPADWRVLSTTADFVEFVMTTAGKSGSELFQALNEGGHWNTWAHWQIGFAYAKYLSPEFHAWCNTVVRDRMEGRLPPEAVAGLDAQIARLFDMALAQTKHEIAELKARVAILSAPNGQFKTSTEYVPALTVVVDANVPQRGRGGLVRAVSNALDRFCRREGFPVRSEAHTERRLFHVDAVSRWTEAEGRALIRRHLDRLAGQSVMKFRRPSLVRSDRPSA